MGTEIAVEDCTNCNHTGHEPGYGPNHHCRTCWGRSRVDLAVIAAGNTKSPNPKDAIAGAKVPLHLLSPIASAHWALAQFAGALKYGFYNWRGTTVKSMVYASAAKRHIDAYISGEEFDPVDGTHHLGNVMACCAIVLDAEEAGTLDDDRPPVVGIRRVYAWVETQMAVLREKYKDLKPTHYTEKEHGKR